MCCGSSRKRWHERKFKAESKIPFGSVSFNQSATRRKSSIGGVSPRSASPRSANKNWDQKFHGASNGFRKGKSKQTGSQGSDTSRRAMNGSNGSW
ncbi:hypothetical protein FACUT_14004 [Fusarium acutatum]|uniref:Uncharacterized protein n=1 Tax=Fusarium acutatum TaxID=78861 RepID=A0A8H4J840_9HYPO|nr:hypothetical protein FACUT_14004 [Fusarium acutatum]